MNEERLRICYVADLGSFLARRWISYFARRGHSVTVFSPPIRSGQAPTFGPGTKPGRPSHPSVAEAELPDVRIHTLFRRPGMPKLIQLANVFSLHRILRASRPHVLHAHYVRIYGWIAALTFFRPLVLTVWGGDILEDQGAFADLLGRKLTPFSLKRAALVTGHSTFLKQRVIQIGKPESQVHLVGCPGVDRKLFRPGVRTDAIRRELGLQGTRIVLCTRIMDTVYNTETILRAIPFVLKEVPEARFVFSQYLARPPYVEQMKDLARELSIKDSLLFLEEIPFDRMPLFLNLAEILVSIPDSDSGMPQTVLEAMCCGTVPVVSDLPQYQDLIIPETNALVVCPKDPMAVADAILKLLRDPVLRERLSEACVNTTMYCVDYETEMQKMEKFYYELSGI
ncbi:MAG: glycosyltransferase family 4 protein [Candidatus Eiseniibacteriota bacterium]|nr:MAG: glycosyltransferase family 4 protein [Candidatus Eisenbacteria bacterium]